jgi:hypothetical protein
VSASESDDDDESTQLNCFFGRKNLSPDSIVIVSDGIVKEMFKISFLVEQMPALRTLYESASLGDKKYFLINAAHTEFDKACAAAAAELLLQMLPRTRAPTSVPASTSSQKFLT